MPISVHVFLAHFKWKLLVKDRSGIRPYTLLNMNIQDKHADIFFMNIQDKHADIFFITVW